MENIAVETTQNVSIEYEVAGLLERIGAALLDFVIMFGYIMLISFIFSMVAQVAYSSGYGRGSTAYVVVMIILFLPVMFYSLVFETFMNGQSIGKRVLRIKVMRLDGRQPSFGNYIMRWVLRIIDIFLALPVPGLIAIITIAINGKGQRLGDLAAGTMVIKIKHKQAISKTAFVNVEETYIPTYPEVSLLTDREANIIRKVLLLRKDENRDEVEEKLVFKLSQYLAVQSREATNKDFLKIILKDYNKVNGRA